MQAIPQRMFQPTTFIFLVAILAWSANGQIENCGIIGQPVQIKKAPYLVSVLKDNEHVCSGVIYTDKFILTAAECVKNLAISDLKVHAFSAIRNAGGSVEPVCKRLIHGQASKKTYDSNLALLELCDPLPLTDGFRAIKAVDRAPDEGTKVAVFGWGSIGFWGKLTKRCWAESSSVLRQADVQIYNVASCAADRRGWYQPWGKGVTELNICTSKPDKLCSYDMGSPLVKQEEEGEDRLVGILSKGDCSKKPDVYSSLANHKNWLKSKTRNEVNNEAE